METIINILQKKAIEIPHKFALFDRKDQITYKDLYNQVEILAKKLKALGLKKGDSIIISAVSNIKYVSLYLAAQRLGAVTISVERAAVEETFKYIVDISKAKMFLTAGKRKSKYILTYSFSEVFDFEEQEIDEYEWQEEEIREIIFTTGTTGKPKGAMNNVKSIYAGTINTAYGIGMEENDILLLPLPLQHSFGLRVLRAAFFVGATIVLQNGLLFPNETKNNIEKYSCTGLAYITAGMKNVLNTMGEEFVSEVFGKLRYIEFSAGAVNLDLRKKLVKLLPNTKLYNTWGSSETGGCLFIDFSSKLDRIDSAGRTLEGIDVSIFKENENKKEENITRDTIGRMALRGNMNMVSYLNNEEANKNTLVDGWLLTNDLISIDEDGYVKMLGRYDDVINVGGEKVSPIEVENISSAYEGILETGCTGVSNEKSLFDEKIVLFINVKDKENFDLKKFHSYLTKNLEEYKVPEEIILTDNIPRNNMGKIIRKELKLLYDKK